MKSEKRETDLKERLEVIGQMEVLDMHTHLVSLSEETKAKEELALRKTEGIASCISTGTPQEWKIVQKFRERPEILASFGIHPWYAGQHLPEHEMEAYCACDFIGEIGMDNVWCQVPESVQRSVFARQLEIAEELHKPVLLHTKGMEREIARMLEGFSQPVCIHWYSGTESDLEEYLRKGYFFTIGPDFGALRRLCLQGEKGIPTAWNTEEQREKWNLYCKMLKEIPKDRLFVETDGVSAIAWAMGVEETELSALSRTLKENRDAMADTWKESPREVKQRMFQNLREFLTAGREEK